MHDIRPEKAIKVAELKELLAGSKGVVLVDYCGLSVAEDTELRSKMREAGIKYMVAKNTFVRILCAGSRVLKPGCLSGTQYRSGLRP